MKYEDYVDLGYRPAKDDLVCEFYLEPATRNAAGAVAAESSVGTWTEVTTALRGIEKLAARVFSIKGNVIKVAYPIELFEPGNMPNIMSSIAGNVFGMREIRALRLNDIHFPERLLKSFKGPTFGIIGIRKLLKVKRPLIGTIIKPKLGLQTEEHARVAYQAWLGGCDIVKDDENLSSQSFNKFEKRLRMTVKAKEKAERETGEKKIYMINVTAETKEMLRRAKLVADYGNEYVMVDIVTCGWSGLQSLRDANDDLRLVLHGHRAGHAAFTRNPKHGISMKVVARVARMIGMDQLHIGTVVGKMFETQREVLENQKALTEKSVHKPVLPVASGGLHPGHVPRLLKIFGKDIVIQMGGGIHGHPNGTSAGARAARQALDASMKKISLGEYAQTHPELEAALRKFGKV